MSGSKRVQRLKEKQVRAVLPVSSGKTRVVGYMRVSTEGQFSDGFGMEAQERSIRAFCDSQGYDLVDLVSDRISGASPPPERAGFARILKLAEAKAFTVLLIFKFDRLARSVIHAVTTVHMLRDRYGVVVRSVTEPIDTATPMGEMIFTVLASMAAQERATIVERTWGGRKEKARDGGIACGFAPYGYRRREDGSYDVEEGEAAVVRQIFAMRKEGALLREIVDHLNAECIPTRLGKKWRVGGISYLLDNPKYRGQVEYLFSDQTHVLRKGQHEAII